MFIENEDHKYLLALQLFAGEEEDQDDTDLDADEEDVEDGELPDDKDTDEDTGEDLEDEETPEEELEDEKPKKKDKKEAAIIKAKKENKELKARLAELEKKERDKELANARETRINKLIDEGYGEAQAKAMVSDEFEKKSLQRRLDLIEIKQLESKVPGISNYADKIMDYREKYPDFTAEEVYRAKFSQESEYDRLTTAEQIAAQKRKKASGQKHEGGSIKGNEKEIKLSAADERSFRQMKTLPAYKSLSRKEYKKIMDIDEIVE